MDENIILAEASEITWLFLDEDNRIVGFSYCDPSTYDDPMVEGHEIAEIDDAVFQTAEHDPFEYLFIDGSLVWSPTPEQIEKNAMAEAPSAAVVLKAIFESQPEIMQAIPDESLATMGCYMPAWEAGKDYVTGDLREYLYIPYRCLQNHTSIQEWNPADAVSLWARVLIPDPSVVPEWEQPDSTNPYMTGDHVMHNGVEWVSIIDNNVWEPGVYGWDQVA